MEWESENCENQERTSHFQWLDHQFTGELSVLLRSDPSVGSLANWSMLCWQWWLGKMVGFSLSDNFDGKVVQFLTIVFTMGLLSSPSSHFYIQIIQQSDLALLHYSQVRANSMNEAGQVKLVPCVFPVSFGSCGAAFSASIVPNHCRSSMRQCVVLFWWQRQKRSHGDVLRDLRVFKTPYLWTMAEFILLLHQKGPLHSVELSFDLAPGRRASAAVAVSCSATTASIISLGRSSQSGQMCQIWSTDTFRTGTDTSNLVTLSWKVGDFKNMKFIDIWAMVWRSTSRREKKHTMAGAKNRLSVQI